MEHQFCPYCMTPVEAGKPCGACGLTQGSYTPSPHHLPPGTVLKERYLVGRVLGEGGFGITYIGCDLQLELKVAIKEYFPTDKASRVSQASLDVSSYTGAAGVNYDKGLEKFLQEARTIARMDKQPVIVNVRDFFQANHTAYIVMEYVEGTTFKELVEQRGGRIPAGELLYLIEPLFFALKEMHANGLIHRDISPENLMIEKGEVRLLDFGCARQSADGGNTLTIALKHGYAPVEQYQSKGQGPWTDVYALSATIYYCLTGHKPPQAMDRLVEDELTPPRKLGVDLTQRQEKALLYGMGVPPKRRFQSMEEFHTALYEGFVPGAAEETGSKTEPTVTNDAADTGGADSPEKTGETGSAATETSPARPLDPAAWLEKHWMPVSAAAAALVLCVALFFWAPWKRASPITPPGAAASGAQGSLPPTQEPALAPEVDYLARFMETVEWLRLDDVEVDGAELRAKLDALPIDELFAGAVHVTTLAELDRALDQADKPIVIDADIDFSLDDENRNNRVPVLISEGVTVSGAWQNYGRYENVPKDVDACWTVDGSILINRGTLRGAVILGDWDNDGAADTNVLLNYGTLYSDLGAGYNNDGYNVVVNLGTMGIPASQYRQTSFYNLGAILHGTIAPEGETPLVTTALGGDYFIDIIGSYFYNGGEIVLEGPSEEKRSRIDVADTSRFVNRGAIRLGRYGQLNNHATLLNYGEITATESTGEVQNLGLLRNAGTDCVLDEARCNNVGVIQAGSDTPVDLSAVRDGGGGAVLPFDWQEGMEQLEGCHFPSNEEEFYQALEDRDCAWIVLNDNVSLTLTEDLILTKGLAIPDGSSLTMEGAGLTVAGEDGYLYAGGAIDLGGWAFTVRDEASAVVNELVNCGGAIVKNNGHLMLLDGMHSDKSTIVHLLSGGYLTGIAPMELHWATVWVEQGVLRSCGGVELYGCTVDVGEQGNFATDGCGLYFDPDTVITNYGDLAFNGWDAQELACQLTNYGHLSTNDQTVISGALVNHGHFDIWTSEESRIRVSGSLENHGTVELYRGGRFQPWAAGTITGVPEEYVAD